MTTIADQMRATMVRDLGGKLVDDVAGAFSRVGALVNDETRPHIYRAGAVAAMAKFAASNLNAAGWNRSQGLKDMDLAAFYAALLIAHTVAGNPDAHAQAARDVVLLMEHGSVRTDKRFTDAVLKLNSATPLSATKGDG